MKIVTHPSHSLHRARKLNCPSRTGSQKLTQPTQLTRAFAPHIYRLAKLAMSSVAWISISCTVRQLEAVVVLCTCTLSPALFLRPQLLCSAGSYCLGDVSALCSTSLPSGMYCPAGTGSAGGVPCPSGMVRATGTSTTSCSPCPSGNYCPTPTLTTPCPVGRFVKVSVHLSHGWLAWHATSAVSTPGPGSL